ncbi:MULTISPECIES: S8 family serine peptidase [Rhodopseudomonas]|uniref:S8 family serine peptidase n=1 Tax=Rhodopseudomonas TaxID=1073 RepID=UPI000697176E|nr:MULTISPECIES: S8 family serine peptidase [Rhodopseudomonas]MDF3812301.1 S8 family serine peptidase [Rhodopseudomonas sp. BAL398]WOK16042.1 S8 family serine peptidase [Rhodopseudomonas sp. BAL398]
MSEHEETQGGQADAATTSTGRNEVIERQKQYMVGRRLSAGVATLSAGPGGFDSRQVVEALSALPDLDVVRVVKSRGLSVLSTAAAASQDIVVVRTASPERAAYLEEMGARNPALIIERDHLLQHLGSSQPQFAVASRSPSQLITASVPVRFHIQDDTGQAVAGAEVIVYGELGTQDQGQTNEHGDLTLPVTGGALNLVAALYVKPAADYWERFIERPGLDASTVNTITLRSLASFAQAGYAVPGANAGPFLGWGERVMGLLGLDLQQSNGAGVRVAIIDSGCDTTHPALSHITIGRDFTNLDANHEPDQTSWRTDVFSHGSHCAGVIAGNGRGGHIRGFAPAAEVHVLKVFPGGAFNNLAAAINYCIDNQIHVVNCSLGGDASSNLVAQAIQRAREAGVALFVAAGNSASAVQFPANVPGVMCVSAIGQFGNFPDYTYHARTVPDGVAVAPGQVYPAKFTCHGPEVTVCGPGVGIISSVPGGGYAAWDGTSMADPHLTGLGALAAAHHPELKNARTRNAAWVDRLFQLVVGAAQFVGLPPEYGGAGLPLALGAIGAAKVSVQSAAPRPKPEFSPDEFAQLVKSVIDALPAEVTTRIVRGNSGVAGANGARDGMPA